jgi:uncharacterized protein (TIGR02246 family)
MSDTTDTYEIATTPAEVVRIYTGLLNAGDVEGLMTMYDKDATFSPEFGALVTGADQIREVVAALAATPPKAVSNVTWVQQVGDYALVLNDYTIEGTGPDGAPVETKGRSADVVHRDSDGAWRFLIDCLWAGTAT